MGSYCLPGRVGEGRVSISKKKKRVLEMDGGDVVATCEYT